jgi:hypothetical protein
MEAEMSLVARATGRTIFVAVALTFGLAGQGLACDLHKVAEQPQYQPYSEPDIALMNAKKRFAKVMPGETRSDMTPVPQFQGQCTEHEDCGEGWRCCNTSCENVTECP